jgi:hypothetical protein
MAKQTGFKGTGGEEPEPRLAKKIRIKEETAAHPKKPFPFGKVVLFVFGLLVICGVILVWLNYLGSVGPQQLPVFQNLNTMPKQSFANLLGLQSYAATQQLSNATSSHISNISELTVNYGGKMYAHGTGAESLLAFDSPLNVSLSKYGNNRRFDVNITSASVLGDLHIVYLGLENGSFTCENFNSTAASSGNQNGVLFGSREMHCDTASQLLGVRMNDLADFDLSQLRQLGINPSYTSVYQSDYLGQNCTYVSGTITQNAHNGTDTGSGVFGMCISDAYYVPLSLSAIFSGSEGSFSFYVNETSISNSSSLSGIEALPGRVV